MKVSEANILKICFNFFCILLFFEFLMYFFVFRLLFFIVFFVEIVEVSNISRYYSNFNYYKSKQHHFIAQNGILAWKSFSIGFVHKSWKCSNFEPTLDYCMLRNSETVRPIFSKVVSKVAQDLKENSHQSAVRGEKIWRNYREKCGGGGGLLGSPQSF